MGIMDKKMEATTVYLGLYGDYIGDKPETAKCFCSACLLYPSDHQ